MIRCLLLYDIPDDRVRTKVADFCLDYGLDRLQYSAFLGRLSANHQEELMLKIEGKIGKAAARVHLFPLCKEDWRKRLVIEQGMEED
ncbi:MAG: CRISPR-associated endonuclease Cas2 [Caldilineaceae bacterium]|nr:CRISPR-associated endonuclease Cas2 [Caldilineaceae bacterium]MDE0338428.1 CRISPR-associated endonuclease Cas2 [Caldilineaceae bacterium]